MPVSIQEYLLYRAHAYKHTNNRDLAVMATNQGPLGAAVDTLRSGFDSHTAVVNLIQGLGYTPGRRFICMTTPPTERCLGMVKMNQIEHIYIANPGAAGLQRYNLAGDPPWAAANWAPPAASRTIALAAIAGFGGAGVDAQANGHNMPHIPAGATAAETMVYRRLKTDFDMEVARVRRARMVAPVVIPAVGAAAMAGANRAFRDRLLMTLAFALVDVAWQPGHTAAGMAGNNIGCVVVDEYDRIMSFGVNSIAQHSTLHGEVIAIQRYQMLNHGVPLPPRTRLYTTLQPCHMCAGMIAEAGMGVNVIYGQDDNVINNNALFRQTNHAREDNVTTLGLNFGVSDAVAAVTAQTGRMTSVLDAIAGAPAGTHRVRLTGVLAQEGVRRVIADARVAFNGMQAAATAAGVAELGIWTQGSAILAGAIR